MKTFIAATIALSLISSLSLPAFSAAKAKAPKAAATLKCPSCGMPMPSKKTAAYPVPIKVKGHTYYCCNQCPSGKAAMAAISKSKQKM